MQKKNQCALCCHHGPVEGDLAGGTFHLEIRKNIPDIHDSPNCPWMEYVALGGRLPPPVQVCAEAEEAPGRTAEEEVQTFQIPPDSEFL